MARNRRSSLTSAGVTATAARAAGALIALVLVTASPLARWSPQESRVADPTSPPRYGLGRPATPEEIRRLDVDVMPNGRGLPDGRGSVADGAAVYAAKCASCHGPRGEGATADRLVATEAADTFAFGRDPKLPRAIGNYWPYATTLYDYIARSMPLARPGSLTADEVYGLVAFLLAQNRVVGSDAVMDRATLPKVKMPARDRFVPDDRAGGNVVR
ncbi:MAG: c-type cytochrome [Vicinamibacterales bacterium]